MAQEWQKTVAGYVNASDYVYASVVDTAYPVKDDFLRAETDLYTICGRGKSGRYRGSSGSRSLSGDSGVIDDRSRKKCGR